MLVKGRDKQKGRALAVINASRKVQKANVAKIKDALGEPVAVWRDLTPGTEPLTFQKTPTLALAPWDMKIFYNPEGDPLPEKKGKKR
jgi:hypothetical protein